MRPPDNTPDRYQDTHHNTIAKSRSHAGMWIITTPEGKWYSIVAGGDYIQASHPVKRFTR